MKVTLISMSGGIGVIGIRILSASLKREGHSVQVIFSQGGYPYGFLYKYKDNILSEIAELSRGTDLIGLSLVTADFENAVGVTQSLRKKLNIPILWGGIHPTVRPEECLDYADMVCMGEGEGPLAELARKMKDRQDFHDIQGMWFKDKEKIIKNRLQPLIQDLDSIPFLDYSCENHYIQDGSSIRRVEKDSIKCYSTMPTRGCPFGCTYCSNNILNEMYANRKFVRKRSMDNIIKELIVARSKLPFIALINFEDDSFFCYTEEEIKDFSTKYRKNIGLPLRIVGATPATLTRKKLSSLVDAGLRYVNMGIETGSERTKRLYKRYFTNQQIEEAVRLINEFKDKDLLPQYDIITDNPWEADEDYIETLMLLSRFPIPYQLAMFSMILFPGTELYEKAKREGMIIDELKQIYRKGYWTHFEKNYWNKLFFLVRRYAIRGYKITPRTMSLLTNGKLRKLKLSWLLYMILKGWSICIILKEVIGKREWSRIINYVKAKISHRLHLHST